MPAGNKTRVVFRLWLSCVHINLDLSFIGAWGAMTELNVELHYYCFTFAVWIGGLKELAAVIYWMFHLLILVRNFVDEGIVIVRYYAGLALVFSQSQRHSVLPTGTHSICKFPLLMMIYQRSITSNHGSPSVLHVVQRHIKLYVIFLKPRIKVIINTKKKKNVNVFFYLLMDLMRKTTYSVMRWCSTNFRTKQLWSHTQF